MREIFTAVVLFVSVSSLHAFDLKINDTTNQYYLKTTLGFNVTVKRADGGFDNVLLKDNVRLIADGSEVLNSSVFYSYTIYPNNPSFVKTVNLTVEAQKSRDSVRRYIKEFTLSLTVDRASEVGNWSDTLLTFVVRPPKFPHFQVKRDWQFSCPKNLSLLLCHVSNGSTACSHDKPYSLLDVKMLLSDITFGGGNEHNHNYGSKIEECPLAYETRQDIGIACIAIFWGIAGAFGIWGLVKFLIKRHRKRMD